MTTPLRIICFVSLLACTPNPQGRETVSKGWGNKDRLMVSATSLRAPLDVAKVRSVAVYLTLTQLGRGLVKRGRGSQIEGDLAEAWVIAEDHKKFEFLISDDKKFSDGQVLTAEHVKCSFERQARIGQSIHFDFSIISKIEAKSNNLTIWLKEPQPRFIQQMALPEFQVLTKENCGRPLNELDFSVTSGPYFLINLDQEGANLRRNPFYEDFSAPEFLSIVSHSQQSTVSLLKQGKLDFGLGINELSNLELSNLKGDHGVTPVQPHIGFTYWLSANPNNKDFKNKEQRLSVIAKLFDKFKMDKKLEPYWSRARQLYMYGQSGRLTLKEEKAFWRRVATYKDAPDCIINFLLDKDFALNNKLLQAIAASGIKFTIDYYEDLKEYEKKIVENRDKYHFVLINNEFTGEDLFENLKVSVHEARPLIFLGKLKEKIDPLLREVEVESSWERTNDLYREIEKEMMEDGLILPLAYSHLLFFVKDSISIERWSKHYPEVAFWKIEPNN